MIRLRHILLLALPSACVGAVLVWWRRRVASHRVVDDASEVASRAVDTWENEGGSIPGTSDAIGDRPAARLVTDEGPE